VHKNKAEKSIGTYPPLGFLSHLITYTSSQLLLRTADGEINPSNK